MDSKRKKLDVDIHQRYKFRGLLKKKIINLLFMFLSILFAISILGLTTDISERTNNQIINGIFFIPILIMGFSAFLLKNRKIVITANRITYEFQRFKWKSKLIYLINEDDFISTSITKILEDIPKLVLNVRVSYSDKIETLTLELEFQQSLLPIREKKIIELINNNDFLRTRESNIIDYQSQSEKSRFISYNGLVDNNTSNISTLNSNVLDLLLDEETNISNFEINYKMKQISSSLLSIDFFKTNNIVNEVIPVNEDHKLFLLSLKLNLSRNNQFTYVKRKLLENNDNIKIEKKRSLHLLSSLSLNQLNYSIINKIRTNTHVKIIQKLKLNDADTILDNSNLVIAINEQFQDFSINLSDLKQGGIISGAIGSGKTTLRLTIMEKLIEMGISILDIDYKGDAPRLFRFQQKGLFLVPGKNLHLDLFDKPNMISTTEFVGILFRSFVETIHEGELTPPQKHILHEALRKTVLKRGNIESFFRNIIIASMESKEIIENYQQQTALALINKYNWLQTSMRNVFSVYGQSISGEDLAQNNVFIDLSYIQHSAPNNHIRFFLDILITKLMLYYKSVETENFNKLELSLRKAIFLDETHMIMPNQTRGPLTKLEELIVTLRHKGISVIATTTNPALISDIFLDSGFIAQFRTESNVMQRSLGFSNSEIKYLSQLQNYKFYLKSNSTNYLLELLKTNQFLDNSLTSSEYYELITKYDVNYINEFRIENGDFQAASLESVIFNSLPIEPYRRIISPIAKKYVRKYITKLKQINYENSYRQILLQVFSDYVEDDEGIPELKVHFYVKCFLYEFLIFVFKFIFVQISLGVNMKRSHIKDFKYQYKGLFLDLIIYIDELLTNYFKEELIEF
ncbi:MAG: hypothetical protein HeimC2_30750 [Candidatus Heimdallarchaeota archaeon LC_2]|nr:MAG: hypothetical protein HeimC2_30750 [Candidatus Heimdallarchaeota archaeon LC_2]